MNVSPSKNNRTEESNVWDPRYLTISFPKWAAPASINTELGVLGAELGVLVTAVSASAFCFKLYNVYLKMRASRAEHTLDMIERRNEARELDPDIPEEELIEMLPLWKLPV